ncbi:MAG: 50S ribosomal protein L25, partial [Bacteroidetes bacterium]
MKTVSLSGSPRENVGKKDAKNLRKKGLVPCVAYGSGEQIHFYLDERDFANIVFTPDTNAFNITVGDKVINTLLQDVQYHPVSDKILHADFLKFDIDKPVKTSLPIRTNGSAIGVLKGGQMKQLMRKVAIMATVKDIPDYIEVDISKLDIGDSIMIRDMKVDK